MIKNIKTKVKQLGRHSTTKYNKIDNFINLLTCIEEDIPTHIINDNIFIHSLIIPKNQLKGDYISELMNWIILPFNIYHYNYDGKKKSLDQPYEGIKPKFLSNAEPIFFFRPDYDRSIEINQKITHILDIYYHKIKDGFCKLDKNGEYTLIAKIENSKDLRLGIIKTEDLFNYLYLSDSVLIRFFNFSCENNASNFQENEVQRFNDDENKTYYKKYDYKDDKKCYSKLKGFQIIENTINEDKFLKKLKNEEDKKYEDFLIYELDKELDENKCIEWSKYLEKHENYEFLPEFKYLSFKPEVLARYKFDSEKYTFEDNMIDCREIWSLEYIINSENQIMVNMDHLLNLPDDEQKYWNSFNEKPKGKLPLNYYSHPLHSLKKNLEKLERTYINIDCNKFNIWKLKSLKPTIEPKNLNYVVTDSKNEWEYQIRVLSQILIEGLEPKVIKKLAKKLECYDSELRPIKQLKKCLETKKILKSDINIIILPLIELNKYRSTIVAHNTTKDYPDVDLKENYRNLLEKCSNSIKKLSEIIENHDLDIN